MMILIHQSTVMSQMATNFIYTKAAIIILQNVDWYQKQTLMEVHFKRGVTLTQLYWVNYVWSTLKQIKISLWMTFHHV